MPSLTATSRLLLTPLTVVLCLSVGCQEYDFVDVIDGAPGPVDTPNPIVQPTPPSDELCDGLDNDLDGRVDEVCYCEANEIQRCYPGAPKTADVGACKRGIQACGPIVTDLGLGAWETCQDYVLPTEEICGNGIDEDCDGSDPICEASEIPESCTPGTTSTCYPGSAETQGVGNCSDGIATCTADGLWGDCEGATTPTAEICGNGVDEDCSGADLICALTG